MQSMSVFPAFGARCSFVEHHQADSDMPSTLSLCTLSKILLRKTPFPNTPLFTHVPPVDEKELTNYYAKAKVFVLPSRAEGLALVLAQAVVSGLPVVYSKDTGGHDIKKLIEPLYPRHVSCLFSK